MYLCMYVRKFISGRALSKEVSRATSHTNRNIFSARLNRSVDKLAERREDGRLFQILAPATAKLRSPNVLLVRIYSMYKSTGFLSCLSVCFSILLIFYPVG